MSQQELFESMELARDRLTALRTRLEGESPKHGFQDVVGTLAELDALLEKLQERYGLLLEVLDRTSDIVFAKHRDGRYAMINPLGAERFGKTVAEVLGADDRAFFEQADAERIMALDREVMSTGDQRTREDSFEISGIRRTLLTTTAIWNDRERRVRGVIGIARDVTERRRSEREAATLSDRMRSMAGEIVFREERLRHLLAAEIHSGIGQDIALARLRLSMLRTSASAELLAPLHGIEQLVECAVRSLHSITFQLSPPSLHELGLVAALQWLGEDIGLKYGIAVRIEDAASSRVEGERLRVILFRAVRELLVNAATHGQAREATVRLAGDDGRLVITVQDGGGGFDVAEMDRRGYGLFGIGEQLKEVGGSMQIDSTPSRGTSVVLTAPASSASILPTA